MDEQHKNKLLAAALRGGGMGDPAATAAANLAAQQGEPTASNRLVESLRGFGAVRAAAPPQAAVAAPPPPPTYSATEMLALLLEAPLYDPIPLHGLPHDKQIGDLRKLETQYDRYCPDCKKETPWTPQVHYSLKSKDSGSWLGGFQMESKCGRCDMTHAMFVLATRKHGGASADVASLIKYGQWPALVAFHKHDLDKYSNVTTPEQRSDFVRAVQSASQGFAAGACMYLRRVLESIKKEALDEKRKTGVDGAWEAEYKAAKTNRQMELLAGFLPDFLLKNKRLYNLLSEGLHNLSDDECRELFPNLRQAIELVFKGRQDLLEARKREDEISRFISQNDSGKA